MPDKSPELASTERLSTGIEGLDVVLCGGWPAGGSLLVQGDAGAGKTTLSWHFLKAGAAAGESCVFISLSESEDELREAAASHGWDLKGIEIADLSDSQALTMAEEDYSVFSADEVELNDTINRIREVVERLKPQRAVLDPIGGIRLLSGNATRYRQHVLGLKEFFRVNGVNALIVSDMSDDDSHAYLETALRGVIELRQSVGEFGEARRVPTVVKLRGSRFQSGEHPFRIETGGIVFFPRLGATEPKEFGGSPIRTSGVDGLDHLLGGGIESGSTTVISGQSGVGKTTIALQFLAQAARAGDRSRVFSLDESAASMLHRGESLGLPVREMVQNNLLGITRLRSTEISPAEFARIVKDEVDNNGARLILIDSLTGYRAGVAGEAQLVHHLSQLLDYLTTHGVTTFLTLESTDLTSLMVTDPFGVSYLADNAILLRFFEAAGEVRRAINVLKKRSGPHESAVREFRFGNGGLRIGPPLVEFHGVLSGVPEYTGEARNLLLSNDDNSEQE